MSGGSAVTLSVLGSMFRVTADDARMAKVVAQLWEPFVSSSENGGATELGLTRTPEGWLLHAAGYPGGLSLDPWIVLSVLRNLVSGAAIRAAPSIVPLHGAAAERGGTVLVLSGPARAGKTTLLAALLEDRWRYVTDDLIPIDPRTLTAAPFPKPLSFRDAGLWRRFASLWPVPEWMPPPAEVGLVPATAFPAYSGEAYGPDILVFPRYDPRSAPRLDALSPAAAAARAVDNLHVPSTRPETLQCLARLAKGTRAYAARYGSTVDALRLLESAFGPRGTME